MANDKTLDKLVEIKKGKEGYGLLVESDGFISSSITEGNKQLVEDINDSISKGEWNIPNPFILDVVLQKYDIENANGRIYPESILKREVEKYQRTIAEHMALGECYTPDAMCLTSKGWISIIDVKEGDEIVTLNTTANQIEFQKVTYKTENNWDGELVHIRSNEIDDIVTPNHGFPIYNSDGNFEKFVTASDILNNNSFDDYYIPAIEDLNVESISTIIKPTSGRISLNKTSISLYTEYYNGSVYCVEVPNHTWYVKQNEHCHWTKNCNHPSDSQIDLGRISHNIVECHWEGHTLVGKISFNLTEGFRKHGICSSFGDTCANLILNGYKIGVSSRGVGSVSHKFGKTIVGDDFELICFDIVATPSTPGAYIGGKEELSQYVENKSYNTGKTMVNEKVNKLLSILND